MVHDFDRRPNPNCPFNHAQANVTKQEQGRRLHENLFALGVNNRRFLSPKTKPCEKLKKYFLPAFSFSHSVSFLRSFLFFHVSPSHCRNQNRFGHAPKKLKTSRCTVTCIGPTVGAVGHTVGAGWLHRSSSFCNFANFFPRT